MNATDAQIAALRAAAAAHGDHAQALICDIALGDVVLNEDRSIESLRISAFISAHDRRRIETEFYTVDRACAECERVLGGDDEDAE